MLQVVLVLLILVPPAADDLSAWAAQGRWDDIVVEASRRLESDDHDAEARYWLGRAWLARGESLLASSSGNLARDLGFASLERSIDCLQIVPRVQFEDAKAWLYYARFLREDTSLSGDLEKWFDGDGAAYAAFLRGRVAQRAGEESASAWFRKAFESAPDQSEYALSWFDALAAESRLTEALGAWQAARDAGAPTNELLSRLPSVFGGKGQNTQLLQAIQELALSRQLDGDAYVAWYSSQALIESGDLERASAVLEAATRGRDLAVDRAHADLLSRLGRGDEAIKRLEPRVNAGEPGALGVMLDIADAAAIQRSWQTALMGYRLCLAADPESERALRNQALTFARAGLTEQSLESWADIAERWPARPDVLNDAALFFDAAGVKAEARALWERAVSLPGSGDAVENLASALKAEDQAASIMLLAGLVDTEPTRDRALFLVHRSNTVSSR